MGVFIVLCRVWPSNWNVEEMQKISQVAYTGMCKQADSLWLSIAYWGKCLSSDCMHTVQNSAAPQHCYFVAPLLGLCQMLIWVPHSCDLLLAYSLKYKYIYSCMHLFKYENLTKKTDLVKRVWSEIIHIGVERKRKRNITRMQDILEFWVVLYKTLGLTFFVWKFQSTCTVL